MCSMKTRVCFDFNDLRFVCLVCPHCRTQFKLDMDMKVLGAGKRQVFIPEKCGICFEHFDSGIREGLTELYGAYTRLAQLLLLKPREDGILLVSFEAEPQEKAQPG